MRDVALLGDLGFPGDLWDLGFPRNLRFPVALLALLGGVGLVEDGQSGNRRGPQPTVTRRARLATLVGG
jgi:hypothetical protein